MARDLHMSVTAMAPANRGSFSGRVSQLSLLMRGDLAPAKCNLVAPVACVQGYAGGTGVHSGYAASETRNRSRTAFPHVRHCFQGGAEGIRTPDLLIAKGCRRGRAPSFSVDHVAFVSGVCVGCDFGGHRGGHPVEPMPDWLAKFRRGAGARKPLATRTESWTLSTRRSTRVRLGGGSPAVVGCGPGDPSPRDARAAECACG